MESRRASDSLSEPLAVRRILSILRRRWWIVAVCALVVPAVAVALSRTQTPVYESSSEVLLSQQNLAAALTGTIDYSINRDPQRITSTQAEVARSPVVARRTVAAVPGSGTADDLLESSSVTASEDTDLLTFTVSNGDAETAGRLATEYAKQFIAYRLELDTAAIGRARNELQGRIDQVRADGTNPELLKSLGNTAQTLRTLQTLQQSNAVLVRGGGTGTQTSPKPERNGLLGFGLGLVLGVGLAFLREALDTRVRSAEEISERLGLTLLARLPEPPRRLRAANRLVMMEEPAGVQAEAFRMLRTNLEFVNPDRRAKTIAVTSSVNDEGKSTTAANLAVALALAGNRVILVDLDMRLPVLHRFFGLPDRPGVTDVVLDTASFGEALVPIALDLDERSGTLGNGRGGDPQGLKVLPAGPLPRDAGEFAGSHPLGSLLAELREQCDILLVDTPPLLRVGDTMALSVNIDALLVVARLNVVSRPMLAEASRVLNRMRAVKLGVVVTGTGTGDAYGGAYDGYRDVKTTVVETPSEQPRTPR
ncbi:MAG TPA: Wzz/FepE/Etk N-terminal domain-containing protein [Miltoncostaeaceae bacterium]|nr:Wzz/FepE/Etk N-terminal domain-containing protein [Miltoncostaeaceae bacterium]